MKLKIHLYKINFKIMKKKYLVFTTLCILFFSVMKIEAQAPKTGAVRVVVAGISHGHVAWILNKPTSDQMEIVGIYEPNKATAEKNAIK